MRPVLILTFFIILGLGCKKNELAPDIDHSSKYQPLGVRYTWIYQVDSVVFYGNGTQKPDTFKYQAKNEIIDTITGDELGVTYVYNSFRRKTESQDWKEYKQYKETITGTELLRTVDDEIKIALSLPFTESKEWDINQFNTQDRLTCYYENLHEPLEVYGTLYDSTATVYCEYRNNVAERIFTIERYGANVGMIHREVEDMDGLSPGNTSGPKGSKHTFSLISFEK